MVHIERIRDVTKFSTVQTYTGSSLSTQPQITSTNAIHFRLKNAFGVDVIMRKDQRACSHCNVPD